MGSDLERIRCVADYQFGKGSGMNLFPDNVKISYSRRTGRIRYIHLDGRRLATMRPTDGMFSLSIFGAERMAENANSARCFVTVKGEAAKFVAAGSDVFAVHVVWADSDIRPKDEVVVVDGKHKVLAVGRAVLSSEEMGAFRRGVAVKTRHGCAEES